MLPRDAYTYSIPDELVELVLPGVRVEIPFGKRSILGYVVERSDETDHADVRAIETVIDEPRLLLDHHLALARQVADRYCAPLGEVLRAMLPKGVRTRPSRRAGPRSMSRAVAEAGAAGPPEPAPVLNDAQRAAVAPLLEAIAARTSPARAAPRRDRQRQDRGVPRRHRRGARRRTRRDRARARDRVDPADDSPFHRAVSGPHRGGPLGAHRCRARRGMAAHPQRRAQRRDRLAERRVRADRRARRRRRRRGGRTRVQAGQDSALPRGRRRAHARRALRRAGGDGQRDATRGELLPRAHRRPRARDAPGARERPGTAADRGGRPARRAARRQHRPALADARPCDAGMSRRGRAVDPLSQPPRHRDRRALPHLR